MPKILIASGPVIIENSKVLLDKDKKENFWKFCGGKIKENENLINTAQRRSKEELGIEIEILDEEPFITLTHKEINGEIIDIVLVHFLAKRIGEVKPGEDINKWDWLDINNLPADLGPNIIPVLKHFKFIK
jgi:8-oxo-dGTP pyrophosphatase MutT (NUDIX family)